MASTRSELQKAFEVIRKIEAGEIELPDMQKQLDELNKAHQKLERERRLTVQELQEPFDI